MPEGKDVYIEVIYTNNNTSEGTNSIKLTEGGIIKEIKLYLEPKRSVFSKRKPYKVNIGNQIELVKEENTPALSIENPDSN